MKRFIAFLLVASLSLWLLACAADAPNAPDIATVEKDDQGYSPPPPPPPPPP